MRSTLLKTLKSQRDGVALGQRYRPRPKPLSHPQEGYLVSAWLLPNHPTSATRPTGRMDCTPDKQHRDLADSTARPNGPPLVSRPVHQISLFSLSARHPRLTD